MTDSALKGTPGKVVYQRAQDGTAIPGTDEVDQPTVNGSDVRLTIDADLQWYAQNQIANMVTRARPLSGYVVVQEVKTGKLRAVASYPTFDPARRRQDRRRRARPTTRSRTSTSRGPPARSCRCRRPSRRSVVQPTTPAHRPQPAAPLRHVVQGRRRPPDAEPHGRRRPRRVEQHRHHAGDREGAPQTMYDYFRKFGIGSKSGVGYPGESARPPRQARGLERLAALHRSCSGRATPGQRDPGRRGLPDHRQRRRPHPAEPRREHHRRRRHGDAGRRSQQGVRVVSKDTATKVSQMLEEVVGADGTGLRGQDRRATGSPARPARPTATTPPSAATAASPPRSSGTRRPTTRSIVVAVIAADVRSRATSAGYARRPVFKDVMTYALQKAQIPPTGSAAPVIPLNVGGRGLGPERPGGPATVRSKRTR